MGAFRCIQRISFFPLSDRRFLAYCNPYAERRLSLALPCCHSAKKVALCSVSPSPQCFAAAGLCGRPAAQPICLPERHSAQQLRHCHRIAKSQHCDDRRPQLPATAHPAERTADLFGTAGSGRRLSHRHQRSATGYAAFSLRPAVGLGRCTRSRQLLHAERPADSPVGQLAGHRLWHASGRPTPVSALWPAFSGSLLPPGCGFSSSYWWAP